MKVMFTAIWILLELGKLGIRREKKARTMLSNARSPSTTSSSSDDSTSPPSSSATEGGSSSHGSSSASTASTSSSGTSGSNSSNTSSTNGSSSSTTSTSSSRSSSDDEGKKTHDDELAFASPPLVPLEYFVNACVRMQNLNLIVPYSHRAIVKEWSTQLGCWVSRQTNVLLFPTAFARGCMRSSYHLIDLQCPQNNFVAKQYRKTSVVVSQYFDDVAMHSVAEYWAMQFNAAGAPKRVRFVPAAVLELPFLSPPVVFAIEPHLVGEFKKHNNNNGFVAEDKRNTPQAFSHYTFHKSQGQLLIVDIQGVGDDYTDPQIISLDGEGYGRGNLGSKGMDKFLKTHQCNAVCEHLGLPRIAPKRRASGAARRKKRSPKQIKATAPSSKLPKSASSNAIPTPRSDRKPPRRTPRRHGSAAEDLDNVIVTTPTTHLGEAPPATRRHSRDGEPSPPQHLPLPATKDFNTPNFASGKAKGGAVRRQQRVPAHLRESILELRGDRPLISIAPAPRSDAVFSGSLLMGCDSTAAGSISQLVEEPTGFGQWGTLSFIESMPFGDGSGAVSATATEGERRALEEEYQRLLERQAKRKADKDDVLLDDGIDH
jgi:hypothetical protein